MNAAPWAVDGGGPQDQRGPRAGSHGALGFGAPMLPFGYGSNRRCFVNVLGFAVDARRRKIDHTSGGFPEGLYDAGGWVVESRCVATRFGQRGDRKQDPGLFVDKLRYGRERRLVGDIERCDPATGSLQVRLPDRVSSCRGDGKTPFQKSSSDAASRVSAAENQAVIQSVSVPCRAV